MLKFRRILLDLLFPLPPPEPLEEAPDPPEGVTLVRVRITCHQHLTRSQYRANGGRRGGRSHWWLLGPWGFERVELPRGDQPVDIELHLPPGRYILGVGERGTAGAIRQVVMVREPDGDPSA